MMKDGWELKRLGELTRIKGGKRVPLGNKLSPIPTTHPYIRVSNFDNKGSIDMSDIQYISDEVYESIKNYTITDKDIYISIAGTIGKAGIIPSELNGANLTENACKLVLDSRTDRYYLLYYIMSPDFQNQAGLNVRTVAMPKLALTRLSNIIIPLPPLAEQKKIAALLDDVLSRIDKARENIERNIENAEEIYQKRLENVFHGALTSNGSPDSVDELLAEIQKERETLIKAGKIKQSKPLPDITADEIPYEIPESWYWVRLGDITHNFGQKVPDREFTYIDIASINNYSGCLRDRLSILQPNQAPVRARKIVQNGCVIYSTVRPYLLNICVIEQEFDAEPIVSTAFAVLKPFTGVNSRYLFHYLRTSAFVDYVNSKSTGTAYPAISEGELCKGLIPLPPISEQLKIVEELDALEKQRSTLTELYTKKLQALDELRNSVLEKAFRGELT